MNGPKNDDARDPSRAFSFSVALLAAAYGGSQLATQVANGRSDWAQLAALTMGAVLAGLLGLAALRRSSAFELALASICWSFCASVVALLPAFPTAQSAGSGPAQAPVYAIVALITGCFALGALPGVSLSPPMRGCLLLVFWSMADGHPFQHQGETAVPLLAGAALLVLAPFARPDSGPRFAGAVRRVFGIAALLIGWWAVSAAFGDSWRRGAAATGYLISGLVLACTLAAVLEERGAALAVRGILAALIASLAFLATAVIEMLPYNDLARIAGSRLHLFARHPNQIAPLFVVGAAVLAPLVLRPAGERSPIRASRGLLGVLLALCIAITIWTQSRGSLLALVVALGVALAAGAGRLPRKPGRLVALGAALALVFVGWLASPLSQGARDSLAERALVQSAIGQRYHLWRSASAAIRDNPWFGLGPTQYYAHAQYAEPSFLDGNLQDVHPHSIVLAAAESGGLPGLLLFAALALGVLELGRRRVLDASDPGQRRLLAGVFAAVCGVLAADLIDLSQSGLTLMPLTVWVGLGVFAAARPTGAGSQEELIAAGPGTRPRVTRAVAYALFIPLCAMPLIGEATIDRARLELDRGAHWRADALYRFLMLGGHPWNGSAPMGRVTCALQSDRRDEAIELLSAARRGAPGRLAGWLREGELLLDAGRPTEAHEVLERARSIDPHGKHTGQLTMLRVRALLELGEVAEARALLLEALTEPDRPLYLLPRVPLPAEPEDPPGAARFGFAIAGDPPRTIAYSELLRELEQSLFEELEHDEVRARRLLGPIVEGWRAQALPGVALEVVQGYRERVSAMASIQVLQLELLAELGDYDGVAEVYWASEYVDHPFMNAAYLRCIRGSDDPEHQRQFREVPLDFSAEKSTDLFFAAELSAEVFALQAERALLAGDDDGGLPQLERALYHLDAPPARLALAAAHFERACELGAEEAVLASALEVLLREAGRLPGAARDAGRMQAWARALRSAWHEGELAPVIDRSGLAGQTFRAAWRETAP